MQFNLFQWVREGVRQSVLSGVADAVEQLGTPADSTVSLDQIRGLIRGTPAAEDGAGGAAGARPRRLGRSLKDLSTDESRRGS